MKALNVKGVSANLYTVIEVAKAYAIEPYTYLRRVLTDLPTAALSKT